MHSLLEAFLGVQNHLLEGPGTYHTNIIYGIAWYCLCNTLVLLDKYPSFWIFGVWIHVWSLRIRRFTCAPIRPEKTIAPRISSSKVQHEAFNVAPEFIATNPLRYNDWTLFDVGVSSRVQSYKAKRYVDPPLLDVPSCYNIRSSFFRSTHQL